MKKVGLIGGGNMGEAIIRGLHKKYTLYVAEKDSRRKRYLAKNYKINIRSLADVVLASDIVILAVKPQDIVDVLRESRPIVDQKKCVISIVAGITTCFVEKNLHCQPRVIRAMPNMPAMIAEGITAICQGRYATKKDAELTGKIFNLLGETVVVSEDLMDKITAVSGSGPGYVFLFIECMIEAAQALGLKKSLAVNLVRKTFEGSIHLLEQRKEDAAQLRAKVTSKGGTTQAAMDVFAKKNLTKVMIQALKAANKKAVELAKK